MRIPKNKLWVIVCAEAVVLLAFVLAMLWLWERWLVPGPNGPVRWVGMDFVLFWVGVRAMLTGQSPYSAATTSVIQSTLLGGPPAPGGDPMLFVYPPWILVLILPLALLPLKWAAALWSGLLLSGMLHLIGYLAFRWGGRRPGRTILWALALTAGCLPYLAIAATKGQLSLVSLGALFLAIRLARRRPGAAGLFLALAILKPTLTVLPTLGVLLWALFERKYRLLANFTLCLGILSLVCFLAVGNWIPDYVSMLGNTGGAPVLWSLEVLPWPWKILYALFFAVLVVYAFITFLRRRDPARWFSATVLAGLALFPMRWIYDLLLGILVPAEAENIKGRIISINRGERGKR